MYAHGDDRRRYPRSRRGVPTVIDHGDPGLLNHVDNISANGILCHTLKPIPLMTKLVISLDLPKPENHRVDCEGIVVRCEPDSMEEDRFRVAILYTRVAEHDRQAILDFVDHDLSLPIDGPY